MTFFSRILLKITSSPPHHRYDSRIQYDPISITEQGSDWSSDTGHESRKGDTTTSYHQRESGSSYHSTRIVINSKFLEPQPPIQDLRGKIKAQDLRGKITPTKDTSSSRSSRPSPQPLMSVTVPVPDIFNHPRRPVTPPRQAAPSLSSTPQETADQSSSSDNTMTPTPPTALTREPTVKNRVHYMKSGSKHPRKTRPILTTYPKGECHRGTWYYSSIERSQEKFTQDLLSA